MTTPTPMATGWETVGDWRGNYAQPEPPTDPQPGDVWLDVDDDAGDDVEGGLGADLGALTDRVGALESTVAERAGLGDRVTAVESTVAGLPDLGALVARITALETTVAAPRFVDHAPAITLTPTEGTWVDRVQWAATGDTTITPDGGVDGQMLKIVVLGSGGDRTVTFADVRLSTGLADRAFDVPAGQALLAAVERAAGFYVLTAATVSGTE